MTTVLAACTSDGDSAASPSRSGGAAVTDPGAAGASLAGSTGPAASGSTPPTAATLATPTTTSAGRAPAGGGIDSTVPARKLVTKAPVPLRSVASFDGRVTAKITDLAAIKAVGRGAGEISGPALRVTFTLINGSGKSVSLRGVTADLTDSNGAPTVSMTGTPANPFSGTVAAGGSRKGVYVFSVATDRRRPVTISLNYSAGSPVVLFKGNAS